VRLDGATKSVKVARFKDEAQTRLVLESSPINTPTPPRTRTNDQRWR